MKSLLKAFARSRAGNFAVLTGICMIPVLGAAGLAVDYARVSNARSSLYDAADAAATTAVSQASPTYRNGGTWTGDWSKQDAEQHAMGLFEANVVNNVDFRLESATTDVSRQGRKIIAKVDFIAKVPMTFMRILGQPDATITGAASAAVDIAPYIDFYLLLDNSPSMGLGATPKDISRLESLTPKKCAFACHTTNDPAENYYAIAKANNITMRIDVVRQAAQNLFDKAAAMRLHDNQFRMALYSFGARAEDHKLTKVAPLSSDLTAGKAMAAAVDLMTIPRQNYNSDQQTELDKIFAALGPQITNPGTGDSNASREKIVLFVSDGVADQPKSNCTQPKAGANRCQEPIDPKICKALKERGVRVAVLYTTYQPVNEAWYNSWIHPFQPTIGSKMSECATPGFYFEVSPSEGIVEAMERLFIKVIGNPRITG